ncbi:hypothetical protein BpHYR1_015286 [Brachionus plicatilis]|uniref:Uncharacterized protein n=1 Tax=Brachionus plicatilis TaxID=10195 RepID=A0A3M7QQT5_BRAPC|nr:hypothetical protein BpHYR1_015286 [Brachionus plicatilis]
MSMKISFPVQRSFLDVINKLNICEVQIFIQRLDINEHGIIKRCQKIIHLTLIAEYWTILDQTISELLKLAIYLEGHSEQALESLSGRVVLNKRVVPDELPGTQQPVLGMHLGIQVKVDEHILAIVEAESVGSKHYISHKISGTAQKHHTELVGHVID